MLFCNTYLAEGWRHVCRTHAQRSLPYRSYRIRLELLLGIPRHASDQDIHELFDGCFMPNSVISLSDLRLLSPLERDQIIPLRTLRDRAARNQRLTVYESDRLFRFVHITAMAEVLFGDETKARRWLSKSKERLAGRKPYEMLSTTPAHGRSS